MLKHGGSCVRRSAHLTHNDHIDDKDCQWQDQEHRGIEGGYIILRDVAESCETDDLDDQRQ